MAEIGIVEWRELLNEFVKLCFQDGKYVRDAQRGDVANARLNEILDLTRSFEENHPRYYVVCIKGCYLGQGVSLSPLEIWGDTTDPEQAQRDLKMLNTDSFAGPDCFNLAVDPR